MRLTSTVTSSLMAVFAVGLLLPTAAAAALPARAGPSVVTGYLDGPVDLTPEDESPGGALVPIASLAVGKGEWVAFATFDVSGSRGDPITCRLKAGTDLDRIAFFPQNVYAFDGNRADSHLSLVVAHGFGNGGGTIVLACLAASDGYLLRASAIRIVAVRTARLRTVDLSNGSHTVSGDTIGWAASTIFHGRRSGPVKITGDGATPTKVAELPLGPGSWWVHATTMLESPMGEEAVTVTCELVRSATPSGSGDADTASSGMYSANSASGRPQATLDAAMTFSGSGGSAQVRCSTPEEWDANARWIRITAVKASRLQRLFLPSGQDVTVGSGHPYVVAARRPGPQSVPSTAWKTMAAVHLKKGRWLVSGKVDVHSDMGQYGRFQDRCRLATGPYTDGGTAGSWHGSATLQLRFIITVFSDDGGAVKLQCRKVVNPPNSAVTVKRIRMTALQLSEYTRKPIEP